MNEYPVTSIRPYYVRAVYEWCTDNGFTPYVVVKVDGSVQVPAEYVRDGEITLNISLTSTAELELENDYIRFQARFAGEARQVIIPVDHVVAIFARENGMGMAFPTEDHMPGESTQMGRRSSVVSPALHVVAGEKNDIQEQTPEVKEDAGTEEKPEKKEGKPGLRIID